MLGTVASAPSTLATDYTATKHGVMGLTKTDAIFYGTPEYRIRINAMCPGYVATPLLLQARESGIMDGEVAKVPMGRMAMMEEIGDAITFLSSPLASYVCGHGLLVDGGYTA
jgi:NAD(P)-dependent dehydrogenase (short-subunit alcohol dehydrogenase family)